MSYFRVLAHIREKRVSLFVQDQIGLREKILRTTGEQGREPSEVVSSLWSICSLLDGCQRPFIATTDLSGQQECKSEPYFVKNCESYLSRSVVEGKHQTEASADYVILSHERKIHRCSNVRNASASDHIRSHLRTSLCSRLNNIYRSSVALL